MNPLIAKQFLKKDTNKVHSTCQIRCPFPEERFWQNALLNVWDFLERFTPWPQNKGGRKRRKKASQYLSDFMIIFGGAFLTKCTDNCRRICVRNIHTDRQTVCQKDTNKPRSTCQIWCAFSEERFWQNAQLNVWLFSSEIYPLLARQFRKKRRK